MKSSLKAPQKRLHRAPSFFLTVWYAAEYNAVVDAPRVTTGREKTIQSMLRQMQSPMEVSAVIRGLSYSNIPFMLSPLPFEKCFYGLVYSLREVNSTELFSAKI